MKLNKKKLNSMFEEMELAPTIYHPSIFWQKLNKVHIKQLSEGGINNFKRSVNMRYFNWGILGIIIHQLSPIFYELKRGNINPFFQARFNNYRSKLNGVRSFSVVAALIHKIYVAFLADYIAKDDTLGILENISESSTGNPFLVTYKQKRISQDLCNSICEFYSSIKNTDLLKKQKIHIADIGAGYGRLTHIFLETLPNASYCIIDIPPALYISQEYLSTIFPNEKIFFFRHFSSYREIKKEFESARIKFLMAHQIELLPDNSFDLIINVSSLHEMTLEQIKNYFEQINRLSHYTYLKQWQRSRTQDNYHIKENEYPIPKKWQLIYKHRHPIQHMFFEALYKIDLKK